MSNKIEKAEKYIRRVKMAELVGTNKTYLSVLSKSKRLTDEMEDRVDKAIRKVIKELEKLV